MNPPSMLAVIVNYRTASLTIACLASLAPEVAATSGLTAVVVDNDSGDGSADLIHTAIREHGWSWATLIRSHVNGGFGAGNNLALARALADETPPDFVWLLNPDTLVMPDAAQAILRFMVDHPGAGLVGTALLLEDGSPWPYAFRFPSALGEVERGARLRLVSRLLAAHATARAMGERPAPVDWVPGASCIVRRAVLGEAGLFDEKYFLYFEETDFCLQARRAGWECWYLPSAAVLHVAGQSTGVTGTQDVPRRMPGYWFESRRRYFRKNHGLGYALLADLGWSVAHALWRARRRLRGGPDPDPPELLGDLLRHCALVPDRFLPSARLARSR